MSPTVTGIARLVPAGICWSGRFPIVGRSFTGVTFTVNVRVTVCVPGSPSSTVTVMTANPFALATGV